MSFLVVRNRLSAIKVGIALAFGGVVFGFFVGLFIGQLSIFLETPWSFNEGLTCFTHNVALCESFGKKIGVFSELEPKGSLTHRGAPEDHRAQNGQRVCRPSKQEERYGSSGPGTHGSPRPETDRGLAHYYVGETVVLPR